MPQDASLRDLYLELPRPGRRLTTTRPRRCTSSPRRATSAGRADHVRPRVHPPAPGPALRPGALGIDATTRATAALARTSLVEGDARCSCRAGPSRPHPPQLRQVAAPTTRRSQAVARAARDPARDAPVPVHEGFTFVSAFTRRAATPRVDAAFANPPDSTEQILHPDKYRARGADRGGVPGRPRRSARRRLVRRAPGHARRVPAADPARRCGRRRRATAAAAAGWGGDRVALIAGRTARRRRPRHEVGHDRRRGRVRRGRGADDAAEPPGLGRRAPRSSTPDARPRGRRDRASSRRAPWAGSRRRSASPADRPRGWPPRYIASGAEIPSRPSAFASVGSRAERQREPLRRPSRLVRIDDPRVAVEGVELGRELRRVGRDALGLLRRAASSTTSGRRATRRRAAPRAARERASDVGRRGRARSRPPCAGSRRSARARTARSRRGSRSTAAWRARCRRRC